MAILQPCISPLWLPGRLHRSTWIALLLLCLLGRPEPVLAVAFPTGRPTANQSKDTPTPPAADQAAVATEQPQAAAGSFVRITNQAGTLSVETPAAWSDVAEGPWLLNNAPAGVKLSASTNLEDFAANWGVGGITLNYSTSLPAAMEPEDLLAAFDFANTCQDGGSGALPAGQRSVIYQVWQNCAEARSAAAVLVLAPGASRDYYAVVEIYLGNAADLAALPRLLSSLVVNAPLAGAPDPASPPEPVASPTPAPVTATGTAAVTATVSTDRLNLRAGPATTFPRLTVVTRGMELTVQGQNGNCAWLRVTAPDGTQGWVSGDPQFSTLSGPCSAVPSVTP